MTTVSQRRRALDKMLRPSPQPLPSTSDVWEDLRPRIQTGEVLPIVGNGVLNKMVFPTLVPSLHTPPEGTAVSAAEDGVVSARQDGEQPLPEAGAPPIPQGETPSQDGGEPVQAEDGDEALPRGSVDEVLAYILAVQQKYPFPFADTSSLARVAQFISYARPRDPGLAKRDYLTFLKKSLLALAEEDPEAAPRIAAQHSKVNQPDTTFSDLATALGYPRVPLGKKNPLDLLAQLRLPVYVTTSYYDFLERALAADGRKVRTDAFSWSPNSQLVHACLPEPDFVPDPDNPVVYHLYGFEEDPESIVLSEDDYLDFLVKMARREPKRIFPSYLQARLAVSSLILIGYRPQDWDFRILFRGVLTSGISIGNENRPLSVAIQLAPSVRDEAARPAELQENAEAYLKRYFDRLNFRIEWSDVYTFTAKLLERWEQWRRGQR